MTSFTDKHYVPILKGHAGEYRALRMMKGPRSGICPMIDVPPIGWDFENNEPAKNIDEHLAGVGDKIEKAWDTQHPVFFDLYMIPDSEVMADGRHPLVYLFDSLRAIGAGSFFPGVKAIPVTGLGRPKAYQSAVKMVSAKDRRGVCLRLDNADFENEDGLEGEIAKVLDKVHAVPADTDLVLDFKSVDSSMASTTTLAIRGILKELPLLHKWRTLTVACSSIPRTLPDNRITILPRTEWQMWRTLRGGAGKNKLPRVPSFGDYGIRHAHFSENEVDPRVLRTAANIRYSCADDWLILKGCKPKNPTPTRPTINCDELCRELVDRQEYSGATFSWGDGWISECAGGIENNGGASTWTAVGTSHHIAFVKSQIASLPDL